MKKSVKIIISLFIVIVLCAGGYVADMFGIFAQGNGKEFSINNTVTVNNSPLKGKTGIFLGSSVTYGYGSMGVSFVDFLVKADGLIAVKEAVSGTTLADIKDNSYVARMKTIDKNIDAAFFMCQLSTNDATKNLPLGQVADSFSIDDFDTQTITGATEYIIAYAKETWDCPVIFYTQAKYDSEAYEQMVEMILQLEKKWDITVIDFWHNEKINNITDDEKSLYLTDNIHPTKAGYKLWWLPEIQKTLYDIIK